MINIFNANASSQNVQITCIGDGTSTTVTFDLNKDPFNLAIFNNPPTQVATFAYGPDGEVLGVTTSISVDGSSHVHVTVTFPLAFSTNITLNLTFVYPTA